MKNGVVRTVNGVLKQKYECNKCGKIFRIIIHSKIKMIVTEMLVFEKN
jgi:hypothetical protein